MACPPVLTGEQFLVRAVAHIDCQARALGSFGFASLSEPGSLASTLIAGLLTLFVALFAIRLLFGPVPGARDTVRDVATIGIVLTLAFSWPAVRTLLYDTVLDGPAQLASALSTPELTGPNARFVDRLQGVNDGMVQLTGRGTGRNAGQFVGTDPNAVFAGAAIVDETGFGYARTIWLAGVIGTLLALRLLAGFLLALTPIVAGLLFFAASRGLFAGWLRGLVFALVGTAGISVVLAAELAVFEPYLTDALRLRALGYAVPSAPTELLSLALAFTLAKLLLLGFLARGVWYRGWLSLSLPATEQVTSAHAPFGQAEPARAAGTVVPLPNEPPPRAVRLAQSVETRMRYEEEGVFVRSGNGRVESAARQERAVGALSSQTALTSSARLADAARRGAPRGSGTARARDNRT